MSEMWRMVDTGLRPSAQNIALDRALLEARRAEEIPSTLRFLRFTPSVLMGCQQSVEQAVNLEYCIANGIAVQRRITGGGAAYVDETQIEWELYLHRRDTGADEMRAVLKRICHAAATALGALGVPAKFRPPGELIADGRKIGGVNGIRDGDALLVQGDILVNFRAETWMSALRTPGGFPSGHALAAARERIASLAELMGRQPDVAHIRRNFVEVFESEFEVEFSDGELTLTEHARYQRALREIDTAGWIYLVNRPASDLPILHGTQRHAGGLLCAAVVYDLAARKIREVWFTGDLIDAGRCTIVALEAALRDLPVERLAPAVERFFANEPVETSASVPQAYIVAIRHALQLPVVVQHP